MIFKNFCLTLIFTFIAFSSNAEEIKSNVQNTEFNIYTGMFDFSDDGKKSTLIGFQHQNENLNRDTFLGNISPITGALITENSADIFIQGFEVAILIWAH
jgi:hypothetical protein